MAPHTPQTRKIMRAIVLVISTGIRAWTPSPRPRRCTALRAHPAFKQKKDPMYSLEAAVEAGEAAQRADVPQSFDDVLDEMGASVAAALDAGGARFLVECLPPGLNPELEMTCPYDPSRELAVVQALLNAIPRRVIRVACPSAGDAAMAARALDIEGCSFCGLSSAPGAGKDPAGVVKRVFGKAPDVPECVLVVRPRNSVGDPVIEDVMTCVDLRIDLHAIDATPADSTQVMTCAEAAGGVGASVVLLNPDLGMKVALGIHQKDRWAAFVRSFASGSVQKSTGASTMRGREILVSAQAGLPLLELVRVRAAELPADRARARAICPFRAVGGLPRDPAARRVQRGFEALRPCLLYTSPSPRDATLSRMPSSA